MTYRLPRIFFVQEEKNKIAISKKADKALLDKSSLEIELVSETEEDKKIAGLLKYTVTKCKICSYYNNYD